MRIGEAARIIGVRPHVLRHWEEVGAVVPSRLPNGHRDYGEDAIMSGRLLRLCQSAGMSLSEISELGHGTDTRRKQLVRAHRDRIVANIDSLQATQAFLEHVLECAHPALGSCPTCTSHAKSFDPHPKP